MRHLTLIISCSGMSETLHNQISLYCRALSAHIVSNHLLDMSTAEPTCRWHQCTPQHIVNGRTAHVARDTCCFSNALVSPSDDSNAWRAFRAASPYDCCLPTPNHRAYDTNSLDFHALPCACTIAWLVLLRNGVMGNAPSHHHLLSSCLQGQMPKIHHICR